MLVDDIYTIKDKRITPTGFDVDVSFDETNAIYKAHFPGNPITPGVCLIEVLKQLIESQYAKKLFMKTVRNVKFLQVVIPDSNKTVTYKISSKLNEDKTISATATIENSEVCFAKISTIYTIL